jgi:hypothetical protein
MIPCLAAGRTYAEAAQAGGVSERTVSRRMQDESFRLAVIEERDKLVAAARDRLAFSALTAADQLEYLLLESRNEATRLAAAKAILDLGRKLRDEDRGHPRAQVSVVVCECLGRDGSAVALARYPAGRDRACRRELASS